MKKLIILIIIIIIFIIEAASNVSADDYMAGSSATLIKEEESSDYRIYALRYFLAKNKSPLEPYAEYFIEVADKNNLDWRFIPAITGVESTYGKHIPLNSFNAYGWANGNYKFTSWENSLDIVSNTLKKSYIDRGAVTINQIAKIYAPPSSTWASKVKYIMRQIDPMPLEYSL